jgi:hypothetical protein
VYWTWFYHSESFTISQVRPEVLSNFYRVLFPPWFLSIKKQTHNLFNNAAKMQVKDASQEAINSLTAIGAHERQLLN